MTTPEERTRALLAGHELVNLVLRDPGASADMKSHAKWAARHYPSPDEIHAEAKRQTYPEAVMVFCGPWLAPVQGEQ